METIKTIHIISAALFLLDYLIKTALLLSNSSSALAGYKRVTKVPSMIISTLFLVSGIYLIAKIGMGNIGGWFHLKLALVLIGIAIGVIGFKKNNKVLAVLSTLIFLYVYGISETKDIKMGMGKPSLGVVITDTAAADYDITKHGQLIYVQNCLRCHGDNGDAGISGAPMLSASSCGDRSLRGTIRNGRNLMPGFKDQLSDQEVTAVAEYVKTLRKEVL